MTHDDNKKKMNQGTHAFVFLKNFKAAAAENVGNYEKMIYNTHVPFT